jgi:cytochrome c-type biogenesis protein CcmH/NrfG
VGSGRIHKFPESLTAFEAALRLDPPNTEAQYGKAVALEATGSNEEAAKSYRLVLRNQPADVRALLGLACTSGALGQHLDSAYFVNRPEERSVRDQIVSSLRASQ